MKPDQASELKKNARRAGELARVLEQNTQAKDLVEECAEDLSSINLSIKQELDPVDSSPAVVSALKKNATVEIKVQEASEKLSTVNRSLAGQVRDRSLLEHQFAAVVEQEESARHAALHDVLTDLPNRALFDDRLAHELAHAKRHGWKMAVMFIDLDDFKALNDSYGHDVGDVVLRMLARRLKESTRSDDTISRYGGDEFLFLATQIEDDAHIALIAKKIIETVQTPCDVNVGDIKICPRINVSIGIAVFPKDGDAAEVLVRSADAAMYEAKQLKAGYAFAR
jgi:diguanylate cyclase